MPRKAHYSFVEKTPNGWRASVRDGSKRVKGTVRDSAQEAAQDALDIQQAIKDLAATAPSPEPAATLAGVLADILTDCERRERRPATSEFYKSHLGVVINHFGESQELTALTIAEVQDFIDARRDAGVGGLTIKHDLTALTRAMRFAEIDPNPAKSRKLIRPKIKKREAGLRMAWAEVLEVLHKIDGDNYAVLAFVAGTGVRRTEFARMRKKDLDLIGHRVVIPVGKTDPRELPLPKLASAWKTCESLLGLCKGKFLVPGDTEKQRVRFLHETAVRVRAVTGQERLQLHELRRAFASRVAERYPVPVVSALLGHAIPGTTGLYVHADQVTLRKAMDDIWGEFTQE